MKKKIFCFGIYMVWEDTCQAKRISKFSSRFHMFDDVREYAKRFAKSRWGKGFARNLFDANSRLKENLAI